VGKGQTTKKVQDMPTDPDECLIKELYNKANAWQCWRAYDQVIHLIRVTSSQKMSGLRLRELATRLEEIGISSITHADNNILAQPSNHLRANAHN